MGHQGAGGPMGAYGGGYEHGDYGHHDRRRRRAWFGLRGRRSRKPRKRMRDRCDNCNIGGPSCDGCDFCNLTLVSLVRLSTVLTIAAAVLPEAGGRALGAWAIAGYRRRLTRFTTPCPSTPSCSAYAADAVRLLGVRAGLRAAARRVARCGVS
ncbi:MAG TPA: membrane protein insertion efficiency factor YidD [Pseudonocardiaceae bacterium]